MSRSLRIAGLRRLVHGRRRRDMRAHPVPFDQAPAFCECQVTDDGHVAGPDGMCVRCHRPPREAGPARSW